MPAFTNENSDGNFEIKSRLYFPFKTFVHIISNVRNDAETVQYIIKYDIFKVNNCFIQWLDVINVSGR